MRGADDDAASGDAQLGVGRARQFLLWNWRTGVEEPLRVGLENTGPEHMLSLGSTDVEHVAATSSMYVIGAERTLDSGDDDAASGGASLGSRVLEVTRADGATVWSWDWSTACSAHLASRSADDTYCDAQPGLTHVHAARETSSDAADDDADDGMHVERELMLYISARNLDAVIKVRRADGAIVWILGGARSDFALDDSAVSDAAPSDDADRDGGDHPAEGGVARASNATRLFCGQWSAEKLGDKPNLLIYDNGYDLAARAFRHATRFVTVEFDEEAMVARIIWSFDTGMRSLALGGALALPGATSSARRGPCRSCGPRTTGARPTTEARAPTRSATRVRRGRVRGPPLGPRRVEARRARERRRGRDPRRRARRVQPGRRVAGGAAAVRARRLRRAARLGDRRVRAVLRRAPARHTARRRGVGGQRGLRGWLLNFDHLHDATRGDGASQPLGRISVSCQSQAAQVIGELSFRFAAGWAPASAGPLALALDDCIVSAITVTVSAAGVGDDVRHADDAHGSSSTYYYELPTAFDVEEFDAPAALSTSHNNPLAGLSLAASSRARRCQLHMPRRRSRQAGSALALGVGFMYTRSRARPVSRGRRVFSRRPARPRRPGLDCAKVLVTNARARLSPPIRRHCRPVCSTRPRAPLHAQLSEHCTAWSHFAHRCARSASSIAGANERSASSPPASSSGLLQTPAPMPAAMAAPDAVVSTLAGRSTATLSRSAWHCSSSFERLTPPSTRSPARSTPAGRRRRCRRPSRRRPPCTGTRCPRARRARRAGGRARA